MVTEIELKYSILDNDNLLTSQKISAVIDELFHANNIDFSHKEKQLSNHYYDTVDLALRKQRIALRTRGTKQATGAVHFEQTIKTSGRVIAGLHQRPEYNIDIDNAKPIIALFPESLWQQDTDINLLQSQIIELFSTNFTRNTWVVTLDNSQIELAFDSGDIACQGHENTSRIYEIELELIKGDANALLSLTTFLFSKLPLRPGQLTKAARGYALYKESQEQKSADFTDTPKDKKKLSPSRFYKKVLGEQVELTPIDLTPDSTLNEAFKQGINFSLTQLQHSMDNYVDEPLLSNLSKINELLALLRQGFLLFNGLLTDEALKIRDELSYFIHVTQWVDHARFLKVFNNKQGGYQKEAAINRALIVKLHLSEERYPNETEMLAMLHSERFNHLQLSLLSLLLDNNHKYESPSNLAQSLVEFASNKLTDSVVLLKDELTQFPNANELTSSQGDATAQYLATHSLLIRSLLTIRWFSGLFDNPEKDKIKKYTMPWLDMKQGISELQTLHSFQQKLLQLPHSEQSLAHWLLSQSENLVMALDQSRIKALSMKPFWM